MNAITQITVPFHGAELLVIEHNNQPYIPMRPIVENMGLDWATQFRKLNQKFKTCIVKMTTQLLGDTQAREVILMSLKKLPAWMYSIEPNKVKPELRDTVIMYQNECDDVLWDYWTKGKAINPRPRTKQTTKDKRTALHEAIALLMTKSKYLHFKDCYKIIHQRFNVDHLDEIPEKQLPEAVQYVHGLMCGKSHDPYFENHANVVAHHMLWVSAWWRCYGEAIRLLNPKMAGRIHDHFADGAFSASLTLGSDRRKEIDDRIQQDLPYKLKQHDLVDFFRRQ